MFCKCLYLTVILLFCENLRTPAYSNLDDKFVYWPQYTLYLYLLLRIQIRTAGSWGHLTGSWWESTLYVIINLTNIRENTAILFK